MDCANAMLIFRTMVMTATEVPIVFRVSVETSISVTNPVIYIFPTDWSSVISNS